MKQILYIISTLLVFTACQQENYELELTDGDPILIVDARIESYTQKAIVKLTRSTDFLGDNPEEFVNDASVFISVNSEAEVQLEFIEDGKYELENVLVNEKTKYALRIVSNQIEYTSESEMLNVVPIDLFFIDESSFGGDNGEKILNFSMILNVDLSETNYYITESKVIESSDIDLIDDDSYLNWDDESYGSNPVLFPFFVAGFPDSTVVNVKFSQISKEAFDFYDSLNDVEGQSPSSIAPANPLSNISNGAIGNFSAFSTFDTTIVVTQ